MEYQVILLPKQGYWEWVNACKEYVVAYGPNLTSDVETAARYMAPRQVVTFPNIPGGYAVSRDLIGWFERQHAGIRLDAVEAEDPEALRRELRHRIKDKDRYGQRRRPFYLLWPTMYPVITQPFGANPQIYQRFGLPGHEGVDFRALSGTEIRSCFEGTVYEVHRNPKDHAYGIHVRLRHQLGYRTVYGHLAKPLVDVGEVLKAGAVLGLADSTGASTGSHLHLTLKQDGATLRRETRFPKDIIDPTKYLVWPDGMLPKTAAGSKLWPAGKALVGAHGRIGGGLAEKDLVQLAEAQIEAVMLHAVESRGTVDRLRAMRPGMLLAFRLTTDLAGERVTAADFAARVAPQAEEMASLGVTVFEVGSTPNLQFDGWRRSWRGGDEYGEWFADVLARLRRAVPEGRFGFPGLAAGGFVSGQRADGLQFLSEAEEAVRLADWIGVNCYWTVPEEMALLEGGRWYEEYRSRFPDKELMITEFGNPSGDASPEEKAQQYVDFLRMVRGVAGIGAAFAPATSSARAGPLLVWDEAGELPGAIARSLGRRDF